MSLFRVSVPRVISFLVVERLEECNYGLFIINVDVWMSIFYLLFYGNSPVCLFSFMLYLLTEL